MCGICRRLNDMPNQHYRLDPNHPLCWEDPYTLRAGFDRVLARVSDPSPAVQHLIGLLESGVAVSQFGQICRQTGVSADDASQLLHDLRNVLLTHPRIPHGSASESELRSAVEARLRVRLIDGGRSVAAVRSAIHGSEFCTLNLLPEASSSSDLVVLIERFFEQQSSAGHWLAEGVPHLLIRFTDEQVCVGPLISTTGAPCLNCIAQHSITADPAVPALAAQLAGRRAAAETPASVELAAATALTMIRLWHRGDVSMHSTRVRFTVRGGLVATAPRIEEVTAHPECACVSLTLLRSVS